jgi:hypothetical protein
MLPLRIRDGRLELEFHGNQVVEVHYSGKKNGLGTQYSGCVIDCRVQEASVVR